MEKKRKTIFLTGATGFVGSNLASKFLERGYYLKFLARDKRQKANKRIEQIMYRICKKYKIWKGRVEVINGDITKDNLGLSPNELSKLCSEIDIVFHCAANTSFDKDRKREIEKDNVIGTKNILELSRWINNPNLHYISTAYVCGQRKGIVYEDELDEGQTFNNPYEESKFRAELLVREYSDKYNIKVTIYRPAIIVGDSRTGRVTHFWGFYSVVKPLYILAEIFKEDIKRGGKRARLAGASYDRGGSLSIPLRVPAIINKTLNLVTIDFIREVIFRIFCEEKYHGKVYHVINPSPHTIDYIRKLICKVLNITGIKIVDPSEFQKNPPTSYEEFFLENIKDFEPYLQREEPMFSDKNTQKVLNSTSLRCPNITLNLINKLISYCISTDWGNKV